MKKINKHKIFIFIVTLITLAILVFFVKDILIKAITLQNSKDQQAFVDYMLELGIMGYIIVPIIEALQMIVVFISAEFIQISAGLTYPWYIAIPLCSLGIFIGGEI